MDTTKWHKWFAWFPIHVEVFPSSTSNYLSKYFLVFTDVLRKNEDNKWRYKNFYSKYDEINKIYLDVFVEDEIINQKITLKQQCEQFHKINNPTI